MGGTSSVCSQQTSDDAVSELEGETALQEEPQAGPSGAAPAGLVVTEMTASHLSPPLRTFQRDRRWRWQ